MPQLILELPEGAYMFALQHTRAHSGKPEFWRASLHWTDEHPWSAFVTGHGMGPTIQAAIDYAYTVLVQDTGAVERHQAELAERRKNPVLDLDLNLSSLSVDLSDL